MPGHVYILLNASMPDLLKIGMTERTPEERARELSRVTGVPSPFVVAYSEEVPDCLAAESLIHTRLAAFRVKTEREFFILPLRDAIGEVALVARELRRLPPPLPVGRPLSDCVGSAGSVRVLPPPLPTTLPPPLPTIPPPPPSRTAVITVLSVLRRHFQGVEHTFLHPDIPDAKKTKARQRYGQLLQPSEEVLLVYDAGWAWSESNGFIFTDRGLGWAVSGVSPNYCPYPSIKPDEICNGWTGFFIQGDRKADVYSADRAKIAEVLPQALRDLWRQRV